MTESGDARPRPTLCRLAGEAAVAEIQGHLQRIYGLEAARAPDIRPFLVDDAALEALRPEGADRPADEWVLVRQSDDGLDLAVWIDAAHLDALGRASGPRDVVRTALRSFCAAVEGVSHFLLLVERAQRSQPVTLLELEVQAEVDKYVSARLRCPEHRPQLRRALFEDVVMQDGLSTEERSRYREAGRLARAWCDHLGRMPHVGALLHAQRRFWREPGGRRMARLRAMAA